MLPPNTTPSPTSQREDQESPPDKRHRANPVQPQRAEHNAPRTPAHLCAPPPPLPPPIVVSDTTELTHVADAIERQAVVLQQILKLLQDKSTPAPSVTTVPTPAPDATSITRETTETPDTNITTATSSFSVTAKSLLDDNATKVVPDTPNPLERTTAAHLTPVTAQTLTTNKRPPPFTEAEMIAFTRTKTHNVKPERLATVVQHIVRILESHPNRDEIKNEVEALRRLHHGTSCYHMTQLVQNYFSPDDLAPWPRSQYWRHHATNHLGQWYKADTSEPTFNSVMTKLARAITGKKESSRHHRYDSRDRGRDHYSRYRSRSYDRFHSRSNTTSPVRFTSPQHTRVNVTPTHRRDRRDRQERDERTHRHSPDNETRRQDTNDSRPKQHKHFGSNTYRQQKRHTPFHPQPDRTTDNTRANSIRRLEPSQDTASNSDSSPSPSDTSSPKSPDFQ